jgi:glycine/D-amino acid oxidase-like deaminating enzyme
MLSYWEQKNFLIYDLIVVGSGFTGLSAAIHYKKKNPEAKVIVLEKGLFPTGASTKNAGFACFGSLTELLSDFWTMSPDEVLQLVERRFNGINQMRKQFGDKTLRYKPSKGFELLDQENEQALDQLEETNQFLKNIFKKDVFSMVKNHSKYGFSEQVKAVVKNKFEGELDPAAYLSALWQKAAKMGIRILTGTSVEKIDRDLGIVYAESEAGNSSIEFRGEKIVLCTNAFTRQIWDECPLVPGRGLVLLSKPLSFEVPWKGTFHMDKGYVYFRKIDGRLLLGGGRNMDVEAESTTAFETNPAIKSYLDRLAREVIFPGQKLEWDMEWTGIMAFGSKKLPVIQQIGEKTAVAVRLGGMGVALGWQVGKEVSELLSEI